MGKKKFKDTKFSKMLKPVLRVGGSILSGATGGAVKPILGAVRGLKDGVLEEIDNNKNSEAGGEGKLDWIRIASFVATIGLIALLLTGKIDLETFESLLEAVKE